eukprot:CAMPEP_0206216416 /NCGR_PEP_ID=MMETSP0047_2-20121206/2710_1 /ASSEMBLY_ACC=CAM_ASM_000192 /TAXON_ID=195065 /ORGANISM="Chroomonas mesostigmatica_cf, Strain CCMP1168" /LENGTH=115 /DNA_ID=CAMNT_0053638763 /DNA_START=87 /DNA_END=431 /DNA_ORIENTATION=+
MQKKAEQPASATREGHEQECNGDEAKHVKKGRGRKRSRRTSPRVGVPSCPMLGRAGCGDGAGDWLQGKESEEDPSAEDRKSKEGPREKGVSPMYEQCLVPMPSAVVSPPPASSTS